MWNYEKRLQYPINITTPNAKIAQIIMSQYGGPDLLFLSNALNVVRDTLSIELFWCYNLLTGRCCVPVFKKGDFQL